MKLKVDNYTKFYDEGKGKSFTVEFNPGYTCIVGPNGTGKTTMIKQIEFFCKQNSEEYNVVKFDNVKEGGSHRFQEFLYTGKTDMIATISFSSEGEGIIINLGDFATKCGQATRECILNNKKLVILVDGVDSGTSIDKIEDFKENFCNFITNHCAGQNIEVYIIATANNYAMVSNGVDCVSAINGTHKIFKTYKSFESFVMKYKKG